MNDVDSEKFLKAALSRGDREAFEYLFRKFYASMRLFLSKLCGEEEAEDLIQDTFMQLWINRDKIANIHSLNDYLFMVSRNAAYQSLRKQMHSAQWKETLHKIKEDEETSDENNSLVYEELHQRIMDEVAKMPEQRREIFEMSRFQGMTNDEIARAKGLSRRTVEKHISLALQDLRKVLPGIMTLAFLHQLFPSLNQLV